MPAQLELLVPSDQWDLLELKARLVQWAQLELKVIPAQPEQLVLSDQWDLLELKATLGQLDQRVTLAQLVLRD